jgi:phosphoglycerate dehydrogenase-like enzyme
MTKFLIMTSEARVRQFCDLASLPKDWELSFVGPFPAEDEALARGADAEFLLADAVSTVSERLIAGMPHLRMIQSEGVGYNGFDLAAATRRGIVVCNQAAVNKGAVAEQAVLLMLAALRRLLEGDALVRAGRQAPAKERFILEGVPELSEMRVGLVGLGAIARETAARLKPFGCELYYWSRTRASAADEAALGLRYLDKDELLASCDILSLHLTVAPETTGFLGERALGQVKPGVIVINTARGELIDQEALAAAIRDGRVGSAAFDTLSPEPVTLDNPLLRLPEACQYRVLFSPHIAGTTRRVFTVIHKAIWENFQAFIDGGRPHNIINGL